MPSQRPGRAPRPFVDPSNTPNNPNMPGVNPGPNPSFGAGLLQPLSNGQPTRPQTDPMGRPANGPGSPGTPSPTPGPTSS